MSFKNKALAFLITASSWVGVKGQVTESFADNDTVKATTEEVLRQDTQTVAPREPIVKVPDSIANDYDSFIELSKSRLEKLKTASGVNEFMNRMQALTTDSVREVRIQNLREAEEMMIYLIAHFEGVRCRAYWDPAGKVWTYNIGNTRRPDGSAVRKGDCIRSEEESINCVKAHIDNFMIDDMVKYLPMDKMSSQEIAVMGSLLYNTGTGKLYDKQKNPSDLAKFATMWFCLRDDLSKDIFKEKFLSYNRTKSGQNRVLDDRRKDECPMLFNEIHISLDEPSDQEKRVINLRSTILAAMYGCYGDTEKMLERFDSVKYAIKTDSLQHAIQADLNRTYRQPIRAKTNNRYRNNQRHH
ncbi:MAG: hypothetical protein IJ689_06395 [Alphaproteobacteria bacterium]|nr:hypothetical protein [Alphaproteobacteria bacterium]